MITELQKKTSTPISSRNCNVAATNYIGYVNFEKRKVLPNFRRPHDPLWTITVEQDASESINYFLNMIAEADVPIKPTAALTIIKRNQADVALMQRWITKNFRINSASKLNCSISCKSHAVRKEQHYIITLDLYRHTIKHKTNVIRLQRLIEDYFAAEKIDDYQCDHCKTRHNICKKPDLNSTGTFVLSLKRVHFLRDEDKIIKLKTAINFSDPVVLRSRNTSIVYETIAVINHHGTSIQRGHYTMDERQNGFIQRFNDENTSTRSNFDFAAGYGLLLKRVDDERRTSIIELHEKTQTQPTLTKRLQRKRSVLERATENNRPFQLRLSAF